MIVKFPEAHELPQTHTCRGKYRSHYLEPIREILQARAPIHKSGPEPGLVITYKDGEKKVRAHLCFADDPLGVLMGKENVDVVLKMKYHESCQGFYDAHSVPVRPAGYITGPQPPDDTTANRQWFSANVERLRKVRDEGNDTTQLLSRSALRNAHVVERIVPPRQAFMDPKMGGKRVPFRQHVEEIAHSRFVLNICGPYNSIDRKVVEFCAVGSAIISTRGLADVVLPGGLRFRHGHNVWFVDKKEEIEQAAEEITDDIRRHLIEGSRILWDKVFEPKTLAHWWETLAVNAV